MFHISRTNDCKLNFHIVLKLSDLNIILFFPFYRKPSGFSRRNLIFTCIIDLLLRENRQEIWAEFYSCGIERMRIMNDW